MASAHRVKRSVRDRSKGSWRRAVAVVYCVMALVGLGLYIRGFLPGSSSGACWGLERPGLR